MLLLNVFVAWNTVNFPRSAEASGAFIGSLIALFFMCGIGYGLTFFLYSGSKERMYPQTHSPLAKLQSIVNENADPDTTSIKDPDLYIHATQSELSSTYNQPSTKKNSQRLAQIVHEARRRFSS